MVNRVDCSLVMQGHTLFKKEVVNEPKLSFLFFIRFYFCENIGAPTVTIDTDVESGTSDTPSIVF